MTDFTANLAGVRWHFRECVYCFGRGTVPSGSERYGMKRCASCSGKGYIRTTNHEIHRITTTPHA